MTEIFKLVGGDHDGHEGPISDLGENQPNVILSYRPGDIDSEVYSYATTRSETWDGERFHIREYRLAHTVEIEV